MANSYRVAFRQQWWPTTALHPRPTFEQLTAEAKRLVVYTISERPGTDKTFWWRVGTAWVNRDGSINVLLDAFPANGKLHIREPSDKPPFEKKEG